MVLSWGSTTQAGKEINTLESCGAESFVYPIMRGYEVKSS